RRVRHRRRRLHRHGALDCARDAGGLRRPADFRSGGARGPGRARRRHRRSDRQPQRHPGRGVEALMLGGLYAQPLTLLTDLYQLTMAAAAWKSGVEGREAAFHLVFRRAPFRGGFTIAAGLASAIDYLREWRFSEDDLRYL